MIHAAETAKIQGVDLYGEQAKGSPRRWNFTANYINGASVPGSLCGGSLTDKAPLPTWEIAYNEYATRSGMSLPLTNTLIGKIRPTGVFLHMTWETLTHAQIGNAGF